MPPLRLWQGILEKDKVAAMHSTVTELMNEIEKLGDHPKVSGEQWSEKAEPWDGERKGFFVSTVPELCSHPSLKP